MSVLARRIGAAAGVAFLSLALSLGVGCSPRSRPGNWVETPSPAPAETRAPRKSPRIFSDDNADSAGPSVQLVSQRETPLESRIVIYSAAYGIVVPDLDKAVAEMERIAEQLGGYVQEISDWSVTIRVPARGYPTAIRRVEGLGEVTYRQQQASDVTEDYVDLEARLRNALAVRERLQALLARAEDVKAAIEVEKELKRIGEEIETLQAKLEVLKNRVAYSTISADFERVARQTTAPLAMRRLPFAWLHDLDPRRLLR